MVGISSSNHILPIHKRQKTLIQEMYVRCSPLQDIYCLPCRENIESSIIDQQRVSKAGFLQMVGLGLAIRPVYLNCALLSPDVWVFVLCNGMTRQTASVMGISTCMTSVRDKTPCRRGKLVTSLRETRHGVISSTSPHLQISLSFARPHKTSTLHCSTPASS